NQSGVARGPVDRRTLHSVHRKMGRAARKAGGAIDRIDYCPHHPDDSCDCRKPEAGRRPRLERHHETNLSAIPDIGDSERDLVAAKAVGARPMLVLTGNGAATRAALDKRGESVECYADLLAAAQALVGT